VEDGLMAGCAGSDVTACLWI